jgi:hypothetical protein
VSLFNNPKSMLKYIIAFLVLFGIAVVSSTCHAADLEIGVGRTIIRGPATMASMTVVWPKEIGNIDLFAGVILIGDYTYGPEHYGNQIAARVGITPHIGKLGVSFGVVVLQHDDGINSGRLNFTLGLSYHLTPRIVIHLDDHISNAGSSMPNAGRDMASIAVRFR